MARVTCAISGIPFKVDYLPNINIHATAGYFHPIFACNHKQLQQLYTQHCTGKLTDMDSYLLFLAFLNDSGMIIWEHPVTLDPSLKSTKIKIENNLSQLLSVLAKSGVISHPSFKQPKFKVSYHNSDLEQIPNWIRAWEDNIFDFYYGKASQKEQEELQKVENSLSNLILSGEPPSKYAYVIAEWAAVAGNFPADKVELYKRTIRSCYNSNKMFNTPLTLLKEIKTYCECNIESGSIHSYSLYSTLKQGIKRHSDYLGAGTLTYNLIGADDSEEKHNIIKNEEAVQRVLDTAPKEKPKLTDYATNLEFIKAKLAYRLYTMQLKENNNG